MFTSVIFIPADDNHDTSIYPKKEPCSSAGYDLYAFKEVKIKPHERKIVRTGFEILLPPAVYGQIVDVSSFPYQHGGHVLAGIIDNDYQGEILVLMLNTTNRELTIPRRTKIAQLLLLPDLRIPSAFMLRSSRERLLVESQRGRQGFGSLDTDSLTSDNRQSVSVNGQCPRIRQGHQAGTADGDLPEDLTGAGDSSNRRWRIRKDQPDLPPGILNRDADLCVPVRDLNYTGLPTKPV